MVDRKKEKAKKGKRGKLDFDRDELYFNEDDRLMLNNKPELERESILDERYQSKLKEEERKQLLKEKSEKENKTEQDKKRDAIEDIKKRTKIVIQNYLMNSHYQFQMMREKGNRRKKANRYQALNFLYRNSRKSEYQG